MKKETKMKAIILGGTGLVGSEVLKQLCDSNAFSKVVSLHRRKVDMIDEKLDQHVIDFEVPKTYSEYLEGNVLFSCLGTTIKTAGSQEQQYKVDVSYPLNIAKHSSTKGIKDYVLISSTGANINSRLFYPRIKAELEEAVKELDFERVIIFRPSVLAGNRQEYRYGEKFAIGIMNALKWIPGIKRYRPIQAEILAKAMIKSLKVSPPGITIYELDEIFSLVYG